MNNVTIGILLGVSMVAVYIGGNLIKRSIDRSKCKNPKYVARHCFAPPCPQVKICQ